MQPRPLEDGQWQWVGWAAPAGGAVWCLDRLAGVDWGLPAVQQPGSGQSWEQRPAECRAERSTLEWPGWAQGWLGASPVSMSPSSCPGVGSGGAGLPRWVGLHVGLTREWAGLTSGRPWVCLGLPSFSWSLICGSQSWPLLQGGLASAAGRPGPAQRPTPAVVELWRV